MAQTVGHSTRSITVRPAAQIGTAANNLNTLLVSLNQSAPQLEKLSRKMSDDANRATWRIFWLGLVLILIFLASPVVAGVPYRVITDRLAGNGRAPSKAERQTALVQTGSQELEVNGSVPTHRAIELFL